MRSSPSWRSGWAAARTRIGMPSGKQQPPGRSVRPALTMGSGVPAPAAGALTTVAGSLDATQRIGANTLAFLTVNTDFAETEVDQRRTNVSRFSLFYPEKRSYFLEGADIF